MSDLDTIASIAGVQFLPPRFTPADIGETEWIHAIEYRNGQDIRECIAGAWQKLGYKMRCPSCGRYAMEYFFEDKRYPVEMLCTYERLVWSDGCSVTAERLEEIARENHSKVYKK